MNSFTKIHASKFSSSEINCTPYHTRLQFLRRSPVDKQLQPFAAGECTIVHAVFISMFPFDGHELNILMIFCVVVP
jgi:hypothetical protein